MLCDRLAVYRAVRHVRLLSVLLPELLWQLWRRRRAGRDHHQAIGTRFTAFVATLPATLLLYEGEKKNGDEKVSKKVTGF